MGDKNTIDDVFDYLVKLLKDLGFPISQSKLISPTTTCNCLGVIINTVDSTLSVPDEKLQEVVLKFEAVYMSRHITLKQLQFVIGSLMFIHKCVKPTRIFISRLLDTLRSSTKKIYFDNSGNA